MDDDFEYHLKLPSSVYTHENKHDKEELNITSSVENVKDPVVILLGWMGCNHKHLTKYSEIYETKGCVTISYIASIPTLLISPSKGKEHSRKLLQLLTDFNYEDNPIFFHVFSNGGAIMYQHICSLFITAEFKHLNICGSVFDSSPGKPRPNNALRALLLVFQHWNIIFKLFIAIFMFFILHFNVIKNKIFSFFMGPCCGDVYTFLKTESTYLMPQLYLYSSADKLILYEDIEELIKFREECLGVKIFKHKWTDSAHVKHFVSHRETYIDTCYNFLDACLTKLRCVTISYIASIPTLLISPSKGKEHARKLLQLLTDFNYEDNPIFFHVFSNGGAVIYQHICSLFITAEFKHLNICGSVFDSSPGKPRTRNRINAVLIIYQNQSITFKLSIVIFLFFYLHLKIIKNKIFGFFMGPCCSDVYTFLKTESTYLMPQLYLYSSADKLILYEDIEELIKFREECLGVKIFKHKWTDSAHVKHFVSHRETYINTCYNFLDACLRKFGQE
ncbi:transmembrane protein 53-like [Argonauta hians]